MLLELRKMNLPRYNSLARSALSNRHPIGKNLVVDKGWDVHGELVCSYTPYEPFSIIFSSNFQPYSCIRGKWNGPFQWFDFTVLLIVPSRRR